MLTGAPGSRRFVDANLGQHIPTRIPGSQKTGGNLGHRATISVEGQTGWRQRMIKIDLARTIPPRLAAYLIGIVPGVFFESSIAIGNTHLATSAISRVREIYPFGPYALLALFLASGLLIGQGFIITAWIADLLIAFVFALWRYSIRVTLGSQWLYRYFAKLQGIPPKQNLLLRSLSRLIFRARGREFSSAARPVLKCLHVAVRRLLKVRYGIDSSDVGQWDDSEWGTWYSVLGKRLKEFQEAGMASRTFLGCGLAGLTALYASPPLRGRYFIALCLIFTFAGCFLSVNLLRWRTNPVRRSTVRLQSVLLELSEASTISDRRNSDSGAAGINPDEE